MDLLIEEGGREKGAPNEFGVRGLDGTDLTGLHISFLEVLPAFQGGVSAGIFSIITYTQWVIIRGSEVGAWRAWER